MRETVDTLASQLTKALPTRRRGVEAADLSADGADERRLNAVGCGSLVADEGIEVRYDNIVLEHHNSETTHYTYNAANELTRMVTNGRPTWYEYDEWGRRTLRAQGSHAAEYAYRYGDKLKGVVSSFPGEADEVAYIYDGLGKMRYRQVEEDSVLTAQTWYRYDLGWNVLGEYADHGGSFWWVDGKERGYVWDGMTALAAIEGANPSTGVASYYTHDHLGSTRGVYGAAGEVLAAVDYGPYGAPGMNNVGAAPAFSYTGKPYDAATGLYHFPYRQYDPQAARWLTRDPLGMVDGPNVYAYVTGNPVGAVDPLGTYSVECTGWSSESCGFWFRRWCEMIKWGHYDVLEDDDGCTKCRCCWRTDLDCLDIAAKRFEFAVARCQGDGKCLERAKRRYEKDAAKCAIEGL